MTQLQKQPYKDIQRLRTHPRIEPMSENMRILVFVFVHMLLAIVLRQNSFLSTVHAWGTFGYGAFVAITSQEIKKIIPVAAYISGAEVLWRMTNASGFWEFGKYATIAIMLLALIKKRKIDGIGLPVLFFLFQVPSIMLTIGDLGFSERARSAISFNLSGALAASVCIIFFYQIKTNTEELKSWIWSMVYPIVGIFSIAAYSTITATTIRFTTESNFTTSGGFGPNQVSAMLGLGAMLLIMLAIQDEKSGMRIWALLIGLALLTQSLLTFSRGGALNAVIGLGLALIHLLANPTKFIKGAVLILFLAVIIGLIIFPQLEDFTGGLFAERFSDLNPSVREELARADLQLFKANPLLGVGPGLSMYKRQITYLGGMRIAPHTEYTRIIAEHGSAGLISLLVLVIILARAYFRAPDVITRAWVVALAAWPLVEMAHSAMRVVSISFMLGLAVVSWESDSHKTTQ